MKVIEALAAGKAVVGTSRAFEGLNVEDGRDAVVADSDEALVTAINELLTDRPRRTSLEAAARAWADRLPTTASILDRYDRLYRRLEQR